MLRMLRIPFPLFADENHIPKLDIDYNSDILELSNSELEANSSRLKLQLKHPSDNTIKLNTTWSGLVFKNKPNFREPTIIELQQRFSKQSKKQRWLMREYLQAEYKNT